MEQTRLAEARVVVDSLLNSLETHSEPISQSLMKAKRLARLLRDLDAQAWLDFEMRGYPDPFKMSQIGYCAQYMREGRFNSDGSFKTASLPEMEAEIQGFERHMEAVRLPSSISTTQPQPQGLFGLSPMDSLVASVNLTLQGLRDSVVDDVKVFAAMRSSLHSYAADCQISILLGDISRDIFENARAAVDSFIRSSCPKAAGQLLSVYERLADGDSEARAQCLTSCRRILLTVADAVFPVQDEEYRDRTGKRRKVGPEEYKNRLLAFLDQRLSSASSFAMIEGEMEHLATRLDSVYEKVSKGVHSDVSADEAELAVIHTYLFLAEVARVRSSKPGTLAGNAPSKP
jgi:hypothetical protein